MNRFNRRGVIKGAVASSAALAFASTAHAEADNTPSLIEAENGKEGSLDWQLTRVRLDKRGGKRTSFVEGYCSKQSVAAGESIDICISANPFEEVIVEIFRTGYYGGRGARLMKTLGPMT